MNRGIARRTVFEDWAGSRYFPSPLTRAFQRGELEIHAFAILTTHFHLLALTPAGRLSEAMRRAQNKYIRWFNRRDGPLFRGRFLLRRVKSLRHRRILVKYIDQNAPKTGIVSAPRDVDDRREAARMASLCLGE